MLHQDTRMSAAESQDGAEGQGWASVLFRDSFEAIFQEPQEGILIHQVNI